MNDCLNCQYHGDCIKYFGELPEKYCERYKFDDNKLDCSWIKNLERVAGWDAIKTDVGLTTKTVL